MGLISDLFGQGKIGLQCKVESGPELKRGWFVQNFQKGQLGFMHKNELYTYIDISKFLWHF